jgi:hypothetical protein
VRISRERRIWSRRREAGIALLISIFILLLISVVAIALIVSSGTESALTGNYRSSTSVYYAALAGVEEVRARLRASDPNAFRKLPPGTFLPAPGTDLASCNPVYILNPDGGPVVTPWNSANPYYDTEYNQEFGATGVCTTGPWPPSPSPSTPSVWNPNPLPFPAPAYKWVRINAITEQLLQLDVAPYDGTPSENKLIYYDGVRLTDTPIPGSQVLEITALAVLPNNSQKLLQYLVAPVPINLPPFLATLTMVGKSGNGVAFSAPSASGNPGYNITGTDQCTPGAVHAIGVFNNVDQGNIINGGNGGTGIPATLRTKYVGTVNPGPDVNVINAVPTSLQTPAQLEAVIQTIMQNADVVIPSGPVTYPLPTVNGSTLSSATSGMTSSNPMTVVINGNLDLTSWHNTGYGLLLVRGNLNYDPDASWDGIVLVVGKGTVTGTKGGTGEFDGAFLTANTLDDAGNILSPNFGTTTMLYGPNMGGEGMRFSSCWVQAAQPTSAYKILSFHEISQ